MMPISKHARAITVLGLPLIGGHLAQMAIGVTDTVMVGWYGVDELAAVTLASTYFIALMIFGSGYAWAVMPLVASYAAEEDETSIRRATRMGLWLSVGFALMALPLMIWSERILSLFGQDPQVASDAASYLRIAGWGIFPALVVMVLKSYLAALERTQIVLWITIVAAVVNALANYSLIFGNWGAPELGLSGAAIASVLTHLVSMFGVIIYALSALPEHSLFQRLWRVDLEMMKKVFSLGLPIGLTALSEVGLFSASAILMGWLGTVPLAAHGIAVQLSAMTFMVHMGLSNVATIRAGNAYGRNDVPHMARGAKVVIAMSVVFSAMTIFLFLGLPETLISLFMREDETARAEILSIGVGLLAMAALFQFVDGAQAVALGLLRGVQDTRIPMILAGLSYWVVGIPCSYYLGFVAGWEGIGVWAGLVVGLAVAGITLNWRFWTVTIPNLRAG